MVERRRVSLTLLDWRRHVAALYAEIRADPDVPAAHRHWQEVRDDLFRHHPDSPLLPEDKEAFAGLPVATYDPTLRFEAELDTDVAPMRLEVPTGTDGVVPFRRIGRLHLAGLGDLDAWWLASYGGGLFVPVKDALAGRSTYGGGRYLLDTVKGADLGATTSIIVVDLNFCYNPSCAYDPGLGVPAGAARERAGSAGDGR